MEKTQPRKKTKKLTQKEFIEKAISKHGDKFDYTPSIYVNYSTKVQVKCNKCGKIFEITPANLLSGYGCSHCRRAPKKISIEEYKAIFTESYPTLELLSDYNGNKNYITVRCKIHDYIFKTKPNWLKSGQGCQKCYDERRGNSTRKSLKTFIEESKSIHGDKYDYSKVEYFNNKTRVCIICPIHGEFWQTPLKHLQHRGCPKCAIELNADRKRMPLREFIARANEIHKEKYDYSKVEYKNCETAVTIICPKHGEFQQAPYMHLNGCGCPMCQESHLERDVRNFLIENNFEFERQYKLENLNRQSIDFYLPKSNIAIECQGGQHFFSVEHFGGEEAFKKRLELDLKKYNATIENGIKMLYVLSEESNVDYLNAKYNGIYTNENVVYIEDIKEKLCI